MFVLKVLKVLKRPQRSSKGPQSSENVPKIPQRILKMSSNPQKVLNIPQNALKCSRSPQYHPKSAQLDFKVLIRSSKHPEGSSKDHNNPKRSSNILRISGNVLKVLKRSSSSQKCPQKFTRLASPSCTTHTPQCDVVFYLALLCLHNDDVISYLHSSTFTVNSFRINLIR